MCLGKSERRWSCASGETAVFGVRRGLVLKRSEIVDWRQAVENGSPRLVLVGSEEEPWILH